jgi:lipocalin
MKFSLIAGLAALGMVDQTQATISGGSCPKTITTMDPFNPSAYLGRWYDASSDFRFTGPCTTATYQLKENGNIQIKNRGWFWWFFFSYYTVMGEAACNTDGKCWVNFSSDPTKKEGISNYNVLYTDYTNVSLVYACSESIFGKDESAWILTRDISITEAQIEVYRKQFMTLMPEFKGTLSDHDQGTERAPDCTYLPELYA